METGKSRLYLPEDRSGGGGGGGCRTGNLACKKIRESHSAADEGKSVWRLPQQQFPFPPTADTMKIVSENNAICRRRVGRNFGVAQFICTVDRELCQGCDVWTTTADLSLCIQPPSFCRKDQTECVLCDNRSICCYYSILSRASKSNTVCLLRQACVFTEICLGLHSLVCLRACVCNCLFSPDLFSIIIN